MKCFARYQLFINNINIINKIYKNFLVEIILIL